MNRVNRTAALATMLLFGTAFQQQRSPLEGLQARIEALTRSVNAKWGVYVKSLETGDFLPYIGNDVGILEAGGKRVIVSIFTANHFGNGTVLEEAIGRITQLVADYFGNR